MAGRGLLRRFRRRRRRRNPGVTLPSSVITVIFYLTLAIALRTLTRQIREEGGLRAIAMSIDFSAIAAAVRERGPIRGALFGVVALYRSRESLRRISRVWRLPIISLIVITIAMTVTRALRFAEATLALSYAYMVNIEVLGRLPYVLQAASLYLLGLSLVVVRFLLRVLTFSRTALTKIGTFVAPVATFVAGTFPGIGPILGPIAGPAVGGLFKRAFALAIIGAAISGTIIARQEDIFRRGDKLWCGSPDLRCFGQRPSFEIQNVTVCVPPEAGVGCPLGRTKVGPPDCPALRPCQAQGEIPVPRLSCPEGTTYVADPECSLLRPCQGPRKGLRDPLGRIAEGWNRWAVPTLRAIPRVRNTYEILKRELIYDITLQAVFNIPIICPRPTPQDAFPCPLPDTVCPEDARSCMRNAYWCWIVRAARVGRDLIGDTFVFFGMEPETRQSVSDAVDVIYEGVRVHSNWFNRRRLPDIAPVTPNGCCVPAQRAPYTIGNATCVRSPDPEGCLPPLPGGSCPLGTSAAGACSGNPVFSCTQITTCANTNQCPDLECHTRNCISAQCVYSRTGTDNQPCGVLNGGLCSNGECITKYEVQIERINCSDPNVAGRSACSREAAICYWRDVLDDAEGLVMGVETAGETALNFIGQTVAGRVNTILSPIRAGVYEILERLNEGINRLNTIRTEGFCIPCVGATYPVDASCPTLRKCRYSLSLFFPNDIPYVTASLPELGICEIDLHLPVRRDRGMLPRDEEPAPSWDFFDEFCAWGAQRNMSTCVWNDIANGTLQTGALPHLSEACNTTLTVGDNTTDPLDFFGCAFEYAAACSIASGFVDSPECLPPTRNFFELARFPEFLHRPGRCAPVLANHHALFNVSHPLHGAYVHCAEVYGSARLFNIPAHDALAFYDWKSVRAISDVTMFEARGITPQTPNPHTPVARGFVATTNEEVDLHHSHGRAVMHHSVLRALNDAAREASTKAEERMQVTTRAVPTTFRPRTSLVTFPADRLIDRVDNITDRLVDAVVGRDLFTGGERDYVRLRALGEWAVDLVEAGGERLETFYTEQVPQISTGILGARCDYHPIDNRGGEYRYPVCAYPFPVGPAYVPDSEGNPGNFTIFGFFPFSINLPEVVGGRPLVNSTVQWPLQCLEGPNECDATGDSCPSGERETCDVVGVYDYLSVITWAIERWPLGVRVMDWLRERDGFLDALDGPVASLLDSKMFANDVTGVCTSEDTSGCGFFGKATRQVLWQWADGAPEALPRSTLRYCLFLHSLAIPLGLIILFMLLIVAGASFYYGPIQFIRNAGTWFLAVRRPHLLRTRVKASQTKRNIAIMRQQTRSIEERVGELEKRIGPPPPKEKQVPEPSAPPLEPGDLRLEPEPLEARLLDRLLAWARTPPTTTATPQRRRARATPVEIRPLTRREPSAEYAPGDVME